MWSWKRFPLAASWLPNWCWMSHDRAMIRPRSRVDRGSSRKNASRSICFKLSGWLPVHDQAAPRSWPLLPRHRSHRPSDGDLTLQASPRWEEDQLHHGRLITIAWYSRWWRSSLLVTPRGDQWALRSRPLKIAFTHVRDLRLRGLGAMRSSSS